MTNLTLVTPFRNTAVQNVYMGMLEKDYNMALNNKRTGQSSFYGPYQELRQIGGLRDRLSDGLNGNWRRRIADRAWDAGQEILKAEQTAEGGNPFNAWIGQRLAYLGLRYFFSEKQIYSRLTAADAANSERGF